MDLKNKSLEEFFIKTSYFKKLILLKHILNNYKRSKIDIKINLKYYKKI
jgi:hypothetical protein